MKLLIAFALFAVAFADIEPVRLREAPAPAIDGYVDYPYVVEIVQSPTPIAAQETPAAVSNPNIVKVVDFLKGKLSTIAGVKASFDDAEPSYDRTVQFVDEAVNEEHEYTESVQGPVEEAAPSDINVNFVDEVVNNLTIDTSVKDAESPLEEAGPVNFVNEAVNQETSDAEIAPSFDSYAGISKLIEAAQNAEYVEGSSPITVVSHEDINPTAVNVVEEAVNMGQYLRVGIEESFEDSVSDVQAKGEANDDYMNLVVAEFPRGKVFDSPLLR